MTTLASASDDVIDEAMPADEQRDAEEELRQPHPTSGSSVSDACSMLVTVDAGA